MPTDPRTTSLVVSDGVTVVAGVHGDLRPGVRPVVLLHGLSQQRGFWDPVVRRLRSRPVITLDQRGHGESDAAVDADYRIERVAADVAETMDALGVPRAHIVGHSWGAAVSIAFAARFPERTASVALIDGGLWARDPNASRESELIRLRPPDLGIAPDALWDLIAEGDIAPWWSSETRAALEPTFTIGSDGLIRTRIGVERHMAVLAALLDYDPWTDAARISSPAWHARCLGLDRAAADDPALSLARARTAAETRILMHEWEGALHDVPLQWPALVAGFIDALVETAEREETR